MKKIIPVLIAIVIFIAFLTGFSIYYLRSSLDIEDIDLLTYHNTDTRNSSVEVMRKLLSQNAILVMGSSELSASDKIGYPPFLFNQGKSNFNMVLMGRGNMQSLHHAISLGALSDEIKNKKVVLIISPQWFTKSHLSGEMYASRFSEPLYVGMLKNKSISTKTKKRVATRVEALLKEGNPDEYMRVDSYNREYIDNNTTLFEHLKLSLWDIISNLKQQMDMKKEFATLKDSSTEDMVRVEEIDFNKLLIDAEEAGKEACQNNDLYIYDDYYTKYIKDSYEEKKNSAVNSSYLDSPEYEDFELFLDICKETGIKPLIVSVPVNGIWYDWTGFPKEDRKVYYQKIRDICQSRNVSLLDFSDKEYEHYFLKDIMHMGWKGWVYLDEAVYKYYIE